jgi:GT2 family glycosyltransferase
VADAMQAIPVSTKIKLPFFSVIVCSYNGSATIRDTLDVLSRLKYPNYEVIVVNDGSKDNLEEIVKTYDVNLITTRNHGLSSARNTGMREAKGEILAYIDDDAYPDDHWLDYLAYAYNTSNHAAIGGPNIIPPEDGPIAVCVANAPGGPVHVLETDEVAEHIPGCNFTVRKEVLMEIGGFDPLYRAAGDDVDVCWRIQNAGYTIGFHPSAMVWHHRRNSLKAYWKQQQGYGKAEALLEEKWPQKYNGFGHLTWSGRIYGNGFTLPINVKKGKIFHGTWGSALFQSVYQPAEGFINSIPLMPEWFLMVALLGFLSVLGILWSPLLWALPFFVSALVIILIQAVISAVDNTSLSNGRKYNPKYICLISALHVIQPLARLYGRIKFGLTPWRKMTADVKFRVNLPLRSMNLQFWSERWKASEDWLMEIESTLKSLKNPVKRGGDFDKWDLQTRNGISSVTRSLFTIEEHGAGKQLIRMKTWTSPSEIFIFAFTFFSVIAIIAAFDGSIVVSVILSFFPLFFFTEYLIVTSIAMHHSRQSLMLVGKKFNESITQDKVEEEVPDNYYNPSVRPTPISYDAKLFPETTDSEPIMEVVQSTHQA